MNKIILLTGFFVFFLLCAGAYAHPPSDIEITFDLKTKILKVVLTHPVSNPVTHFIKKVDVFLNGKEILQQEISRQDNTSSQEVSFFIPDAKARDIISVEGYCSISGKFEKKLK